MADAEVIDQVEDPKAPAATPEPDPAPEPDPKPDPQPHGNAGKTPWYMTRLAEEQHKRTQEAEQRQQAERRAREAEALLEQLRKGKEGEPEPQRHQQSRQDDTAHQANVRLEAQRMRFSEDTMEVRNAGLAAFGDVFNESLKVLNAVGATNDDFVQDVLAVDKGNAHTLLKTLSADPEKAVALAGMTSRARIAELTRMTMAEAKKADTPAIAPAAPTNKTSKAPAPAPALTPTASKATDWRSDASSDEEFSRGFDEMMTKRRARR